MKHKGQCATDQSARDVCDSIYADKCDDVIKLHEALLAIYTLVGEDPAITKICREATIETGGEWDGYDREQPALETGVTDANA